MNILVSDAQKLELKKARKILGLLGYKIFTTRKKHNRSGNSFIAIRRHSICLLCPRKEGLEIRTYTYRVVNLHLIAHLRKGLSLPLRVGRRLPFKKYEDGKRFIVDTEHKEFEMLINVARL